MYYATLQVDYQTITARFYSRADRDLFVADHPGAEPVRSRQAKFVPGTDRCITYDHRDSDGRWHRL